MSSKITNIIPVQNYAALVSTVGAILATEFAAQLVLAPANTFYSTKIWLERFIAFDKTELPAINIFFNTANYNDNDPHNSRGDVKLSIEVVTKAKHTATAQGDALAILELNKLTGAIRYILEHPAYLNLGLQKYVFGTLIESIRNTQPTQQGDGSHTVSAVVIFSINLRESNGNLSGINLDFITTNLSINGTDKGYYLFINPVSFVPTFEIADNGTDVEAFTNELFTIRQTLTRTDLINAPAVYEIIYDFGTLGTVTRTGVLQVGESVNIEVSKVLTGITGNYTVNYSGSVSGSIVRDVAAPAFELIENGTDATATTNQLFTVRKTLQRNDDYIFDAPYSVTFDWGVLGMETYTGILPYNGSINLVSAKTIIGLTGTYTINITGTVAGTVVRNIVVVYTTVTLTATDTRTLQSANANYTTARNAVSGTSSGNPASAYFSIFGGGLYVIRRNYIAFNMDTLPVGSVISVAKLKVNNASSNGVVTSQVQLCNNSGTLLTTDFNNISGDFGNSTGTDPTLGVQWKLMTINASGIAQLNLKGNQRLVVRDYPNDYINSAPVNNISVVQNASNALLEITYY